MTNLIVISHEKDVQDEVALTNDLFDAGLELFHLRKPHWNLEQQRRFLSGMKKENLEKISVHQHHETISEFGLKYCHVKERERQGVKRTAGLCYSTSFHNYPDLQSENHLWDYCFLSPLFNSISKKGYRSAFPPEFHIERKLCRRVFALGGITKDNIEEVFKKQFYGATILGTIWNEPQDAVQNFKEINAACKQSAHMC